MRDTWPRFAGLFAYWNRRKSAREVRDAKRGSLMEGNCDLVQALLFGKEKWDNRELAWRWSKVRNVA
jgi:hypothetical protein